ncbi:MAG: hypothetical protein AAF747_05110 [Planctomycetota bacterium]
MSLLTLNIDGNPRRVLAANEDCHQVLKSAKVVVIEIEMARQEMEFLCSRSSDTSISVFGLRPRSW